MDAAGGPLGAAGGTLGAADGTERRGGCAAFLVVPSCRGPAGPLPCGGALMDEDEAARAVARDEDGSCRAVSLAALARRAAAALPSGGCSSRALDLSGGDGGRRSDGDSGGDSGWWPGSRQHDGSSSSCAWTKAKASRALDFLVGDGDRGSDGDGDGGDSGVNSGDGDDGGGLNGDGGGGLFTGDLERLTGISSRDDAPPRLNGLRLLGA